MQVTNEKQRIVGKGVAITVNKVKIIIRENNADDMRKVDEVYNAVLASGALDSGHILHGEPKSELNPYGDPTGLKSINFIIMVKPSKDFGSIITRLFRGLLKSS